MDFSSLVIMEKEKDTNLFLRELGSYEVRDGGNYVRKLFCIDGIVSVYFDTDKDVEEWEYSAIFDLFDTEAFVEKGYEIKDKDEEYNPTWVINFPYDEKREIMSYKINEICNLIDECFKKVYLDMKGKKEDYI
ncbi:DUF6762 family protein [Clostridium algidicarnis]|uniref:Uncharacterized protein n=1 Tax=Clostridium algidicarnis DSM 15099 TaxID=1121295 RepID=A0A2S6FWH6_9CLOT|nr:DUF6762 family protein [Clostridium algidicarnis]PPK47898.1 hypothetical protein BD821_11239 [Clostridium algidicarnis DSM 15099]